jgi:alkylation response protein AidB-like acyl-CoA dehydrogenase
VTERAPSVEEFRELSRSWLSANMEHRGQRDIAAPRGADPRTEKSIAEARMLQRKLFDGGYAGISWPSEYGGRGLSLKHELAFHDEALGFIMPNFGVAGLTTMGVCVPTMLAHAAPSFLQLHIPRILRGEEIWVQLFSEPEAGSDLAGVRTTASRSTDRWLLNGSKIWTSGAHYADFGMCLARTNWEVSKHRGLTWFALPLNATGVTVRPIKEINGDVEFCQEFFDDVELTDGDVIGEVDSGWAVTQTMLVYERGTGRNDWRPDTPLQLDPDLVALARRTGREKDPTVRQMIAHAHINDFVYVQLMERIETCMYAANATTPGIAAFGKLAAGTFDPIRARIALEIGRSAALLWAAGDPHGQAPALNYLNGRIMSIAGGTNEMQRNVIGERVLELPREPSFDTDRPFAEVVRNAHRWNGQTGK